ncbi:MAG: 30S ribosomal protein S3 [Thermodesulfobacteriota bacterium]|nr:30S ribosomal protein S3 [Thermodesulfobacteriota bacterium]
MGQKVNPIGFRLGINKTWNSRWFAKRDYSELLHEDIRVRKHIKDKFFHAGISRVEIERASDKAKINIYTARPGIIIGRKGTEIEKVKKDLEGVMTGDIIINILEVRKPETDAQLVAENIALQLVRRVSFRRAMKRGVTTAMKFGVKGIRVACAGRLGGAEMARKEWYREGRVPLHTLRADIDYGFAEARTTYGIIGVKVLIFNGEILPDKKDSLNPQG